MALQFNSLTFLNFSSQLFPRQARVGRVHHGTIRTSGYVCQAAMQTVDDPIIERRSGHWKPSIWEDDFLKTLKNDHKEEVYQSSAELLKAKVRHELDHMHDEKGPLALLELIDDLQRLGLGYIFEQDIRKALGFLKEKNVNVEGNSLHATSLCFRLLRQHGFDVSQDVFKVFKGLQGNFMDHLSKDIKGILSLYEASSLGIFGEDILNDAKDFAFGHLNNTGSMDPVLSELVVHALEFPLHYRVTRLEARWYIDVYARRDDKNAVLLELAKLDYNMVQAAHQIDMINISRWGKNLDLPKQLPFVARDRLVECFLWTSGVVPEPQYKMSREVVTKLTTLVTVIDDVYDIYATLDEVKLFTNAIERWDVNAVEELPDYMRLCYMAIFNTTNEIGYDILKQQNFNVLPYLKKTWLEILRSYQLEAEWFHTGYKPTLEEYMDNACTSIGGRIGYFQSYVTLGSIITKEALDYLDKYPDLIHWACVVLRLTDDLGTSKAETERGDVLKSVQCYMHNNGVTEEVAREYIRQLADEAWKKMNAELWVDSPLPEALVKVVINFTRTSEIMYQYGDGHGIQDFETKDLVLRALVDTLPII